VVINEVKHIILFFVKHVPIYIIA